MTRPDVPVGDGPAVSAGVNEAFAAWLTAHTAEVLDAIADRVATPSVPNADPVRQTWEQQEREARSACQGQDGWRWVPGRYPTHGVCQQQVPPPIDATPAQ